MTKLASVQSFSNRHPIVVGMGAGLLAGVVTGGVDRLLDRLVSKEQKKREKRVREASPHQVAGPYFASKLLGRRLDRTEKKRAQLAFSIAYGLGWGALHSGLRRKFPQLTRYGGLPFAIPFFFACDGVIAPTLRVTPALPRIPWQPSAKEMGNHVAWTAAAELVHRLVARVSR